MLLTVALALTCTLSLSGSELMMASSPVVGTRCVPTSGPAVTIQLLAVLKKSSAPSPVHVNVDNNCRGSSSCTTGRKWRSGEMRTALVLRQALEWISRRSLVSEAEGPREKKKRRRDGRRNIELALLRGR